MFSDNEKLVANIFGNRLNVLVVSLTYIHSIEIHTSASVGCLSICGCEILVMLTIVNLFAAIYLFCEGIWKNNVHVARYAKIHVVWFDTTTICDIFRISIVYTDYLRFSLILKIQRNIIKKSSNINNNFR